MDPFPPDNPELISLSWLGLPGTACLPETVAGLVVFGVDFSTGSLLASADEGMLRVRIWQELPWRGLELACGCAVLPLIVLA